MLSAKKPQSKRGGDGRFLSTSALSIQKTKLTDLVFTQKSTQIISQVTIDQTDFEGHQEILPPDADVLIKQHYIPNVPTRERCGRLTKKQYEELMKSFFESDLPATVFWGENIKPANNDARNYTKFETFHNLIRKYQAAHPEAILTPRQTVRVSVHDDASYWKPLIRMYIALGATILNKSDFYEKYILVKPFEKAPSYKQWLIKLQTYKEECRLETLSASTVTVDAEAVNEIAGLLMEMSDNNAGIHLYNRTETGAEPETEIQTESTDPEPEPEAESKSADALAKAEAAATKAKTEAEAAELEAEIRLLDELLVDDYPTPPKTESRWVEKLSEETGFTKFMSYIGSSLSLLSSTRIGSLEDITKDIDGLLPTQSTTKIPNEMSSISIQPVVTVIPDNDNDDCVIKYGTTFKMIEAESIERAVKRLSPNFTFVRKPSKAGGSSIDAIIRASAESSGRGKFDVEAYILSLPFSTIGLSYKEFKSILVDSSYVNKKFNMLCDNLNKFVFTIECDLECNEIARSVTFPTVFHDLSSSNGYFEHQHVNYCWKHALFAVIGKPITRFGFLINDSLVAMLTTFTGSTSDNSMASLDNFNSESKQTPYLRPLEDVSFNIGEFIRNIGSQFGAQGMVSPTFHRLASACNSLRKPTENPFYLGCKVIPNRFENIHDLHENADTWIICSRPIIGQINHFQVIFYYFENNLFGAYDSTIGVKRGCSLGDAKEFLGWSARCDFTIYCFDRRQSKSVATNLKSRYIYTIGQMKLNRFGASPVDGIFAELSEISLVTNNVIGVCKSQGSNNCNKLVSLVDITARGIELAVVRGIWVAFSSDDELIKFLSKNLESVPYLFDITSKLPFPGVKICHLLINSTTSARQGNSIISYLDRSVGDTKRGNANVYFDISPGGRRGLSLFTSNSAGIRKNEVLVVNPNQSFRIPSKFVDAAITLNNVEQPIHIKRPLQYIAKQASQPVSKQLKAQKADIVFLASSIQPDRPSDKSRLSLASISLSNLQFIQKKFNSKLVLRPYKESDQDYCERFYQPSPSELMLINNHWQSYNLFYSSDAKTMDPDKKNLEKGKLILQNIFNIDFKVSDFKRLEEGTWLNDECINLWINLLIERRTLRCGELNDIYAFNSFFMANLMDTGTYNFENVTRWTKKVNILSFRKILVPININNTHWVLGVVVVEVREVHIFDSLGGKHDRFSDALLKWFGDEAHKREAYFNPADWRCISWGNKSPQQKNGCDCGVAVCMTADFLTDDLQLVYDGSDIIAYRKLMSCGILRGSA